MVVAIDVLRATTTIVAALAAGCRGVIPVLTVDDARDRAKDFSRGEYLLIGERQGEPIPGFDLGNSPGDFVADACWDRTAICTTTNGTRAILHAARASSVLIGSFVNFSAICEELRSGDAPIHLLCAGTNGQVSLEDMLFAGAVVEFFATGYDVGLNDSARIAWDTHEHHGHVLVAALELGAGGKRLLELGLDVDLKMAADVDRFCLVPQFDPTTGMITARTAHFDSRFFLGDSGLYG
ncbi:putative 2-phosphosulfolactate phosphatase [Planctomycetes bacterium Pan216]|uniref:Probable 2-phosphosulfolactate phosphatase n=1 Tax=Kolteria novifilia TaxID=2527975 RepID=A0A518BAT4_9BACT|nr:putative 2-phosphosulfolactate phosphatase [Planctomycetes bacterium Pan216]